VTLLDKAHLAEKSSPELVDRIKRLMETVSEVVSTDDTPVSLYANYMNHERTMNWALAVFSDDRCELLLDSESFAPFSDFQVASDLLNVVVRHLKLPILFGTRIQCSFFQAVNSDGNIRYLMIVPFDPTEMKKALN
jgi:hypothetical protein